MAFAVVRFASLLARPWKNGGGVTRDLVVWPPSAEFDDFEWRLSIADIAAPGPFSSFLGTDRTLVVIDGEGVSLDLGTDGTIAVKRLQMQRFHGEQVVFGAPLNGPTRDFNVMTRRAFCDHAVRVVIGEGEDIHLHGGEFAFLSVGGPAVVSIDGKSVTLERFDLIHGVARGTTFRASDVGILVEFSI